LAPNPQEGIWPDDAHQQFVIEYKRMVDHLRDSPCIAAWVPFNEAWGQHRSMEIGELAVAYDKTRHINIASGGNFWPVGDIADEHNYPEPAFPLGDRRFDDYIKVVGEFGGHGMPIEGHLWSKNAPNWGYGGLPKDLAEWKDRYSRSLRILADFRKRGIAGGVYTQTTDVEVEINGLRTYDRVNKVDPSWLKPLSDMLLNTPDVVKTTVMMPTSENEAQDWRFTIGTPAAGWEKPGFDDSTWSQGKGGFGAHRMKSLKIGTGWTGNEIWLRRDFNITTIAEGQAILRMFHDEDAQVFLNGELITGVGGFATSYVDFPIQRADLLKTGRNVIAIHCKQTEGCQFIDAGIVVESPE
jgi:beta-galactosidase